MSEEPLTFSRRDGLKLVPLALIVITFIVTGLIGIDYGFHWDEVPWHINPVKGMAATGVMMPHVYIYPGFSRWVVLLPSVWAGLKTGLGGAAAPQVQAAMVAAFDAPGNAYLLSVRVLFLLVSSLGIVWLWVAGWALRRRWWEATLAAAIFGLNWHFAFHARFVASDAMLTQFSALTLMCLALYYRTQRLSWLYAAAVAAGLATGTKYPGVLLLVGVMLAGAWWPGPGSLRRKVLRLVPLGALAFFVYVLTSPFTLLEPFVFWAQLRDISNYYAAGHYGYTVDKGLPHASLLLQYLVFVYFSPFRLFAVLATLLTVAGAVLCIRDDRRLGVVLVVFPLAFIVFFCGTYRVFIVRNFQLLGPFFAIFFARAVAELHDRVKQPARKNWVTAALVAGAVTQAVWLFSAAFSIRNPDPAGDARAAMEWVRDHPGTRFRVSPRVQSMGAMPGEQPPANITTGPCDSAVFFTRAEGASVFVMKVNDPWLTEAVFGPREIDFNYYSTWEGSDRVLVMTCEKAKASQVPLAN